MKNRPDGSELLHTARRILLDELLPLLPKEKKYDTLMVANAMAIAARELVRAGEQDPVIDQLINAFYQRIGLASTQDGSAMPTSEQSLAEIIRTRAIPPRHEPDLRALLLSITHSKLALSNPKFVRASS